ncbi:SDR family oxidoreductase [Alicyclobacillus sp.]|uniref:SDR family NAD(P)-dependent oxidoreductase n=1 Tax=Alicyclobacillus sp. TaxID=61169 RepID=UPI0025C562D1|nr:SDR family oxidoreductase [Alicyclobacillus sp.]MCL6516075.1 SDR family oxidoreductase [Alicyclobacillus sp.]
MTQRIALITGGGTGIGRACALAFARRGMGVVVNYSRSQAEAEATAEEVRALGVPALAVRADVADDRQVREMVGTVLDRFGRLDVLVNNAGTTDYVDHADLEGLTDERWDRVWDVNVKGLFHCARAAADALKEARGAMVNVLSVAGLTGLGSSIAYAASKAAGISVTKSLARVLAPQVRVNGVAPGIVMTRWVMGHDDHVQRLAADTPLQRAATPEDVAEVVVALAEARFVTGEIVKVDGGRFL